MDETVAAMRAAAARLGYSLAEGESGPDRLLFRRGMSPLSWGSTLRVTFTPDAPDRTGIVIVTDETFALTDWGRGKRVARKLLHAAGLES